MSTPSDMIAYALSLIALFFVWYLARRDKAEHPDITPLANLCECGRKDSKVPYFQRKWTSLSAFLDRKLKSKMRRLDVLRDLHDRQLAKGDHVGAMSTHDLMYEEVQRIQERINKRWMLCRFCWHVVRRHHVSREIEDRCCFQRNRMTPLFLERTTFFDICPGGTYVRLNEEEEE